MLQGISPLWWFSWERTHICTYAHIHTKCSKLAVSLRRSIKRREGLRFVTGLRRAYCSLIYKYKQSSISLQLKEERHMRGNGHGWPIWFFFPCEVWKLTFSIGFFGWIVLLPRGCLCRSHYQAFGSNIWSTSECRSYSFSLLLPPCFSLPSYYTDCMQN